MLKINIGNVNSITMRIQGKALKYGDDINTDLIIAGRYLHIYDPDQLASHAMEDLDPKFHEKFVKGNILVAGKNFGCGSSREQAVISLKYAGVRAIVATSFARIFFRNAINLGIPVVKVQSSEIHSGDEIVIDMTNGSVENLTTGITLQGEKLPKKIIELIHDGGLLHHIMKARNTPPSRK